MLADTCTIRRRIVTGVKFWSPAFTARRRLPSTATAPPDEPELAVHQHDAPASRLDRFAMIAADVDDVLKSDASLPVNHLDVAASLALQPLA